MMETELSPNKRILRDFLKDIWTGGKVEAVSQYLADGYTIHHDPGDPWNGQTLSMEDFKTRLVKSRAMAPDQVFHVEKMIEEGGAIAAFWKWSGTHLGNVPGFPATGKQIFTSGMTIYDFDENRLSGHWQIADRLSIFQQLSRK